VGIDALRYWVGMAAVAVSTLIIVPGPHHANM
jgi:hypothetical protein